MGDSSSMEHSRRLVEALLNQECYDHETGDIRLVETHCAWVVLTGEYAYKIKKPVDFGFLDFSTLEKRHFNCEEEIRLNSRFAPHIYLDVIAVTGTPEHPRVDGQGPVLEYAVRMKQFPGNGLLSQLAEQRRLDISHIDQMVSEIAEFHQNTTRASADDPYGEPDGVHHWVRENFQHIRPSLEKDREIDQLDHVQRWTEAERKRIAPLLGLRKALGFIRECHGDLHLGNITLIEDRVTLFDCIEFNPGLRWIDVLSEVAFLLMDLDDRGYPQYAFHFLNGYLQRTGDYEGLGVLRYYMVYRAVVRAKVAILRRQQEDSDTIAYKKANAEYVQYMQLAERYIKVRKPVLLITHGLSGSGKSTLARQLCECCGMIQIRSDVERKRLAHLGAEESSGSGVGGGLYTEDQTAKTYRRLASLSAKVLDAGYPVILDATFLQYEYRKLMHEVAERAQIDFIILDCKASLEVLRQRISDRSAVAKDASEATTRVLEAQLKTWKSLEADEQVFSIQVDTGSADYLERVLVDLESNCRPAF